ncbi:hypothetical protein N7463_002487 [Penicillium fimorum]|uniref:Uncharacterized protein n=1 Tax=Penicillium fimorum TaxID=1882269 RepID=A0A9W9XZX6_9EURO|nr:hypothetical protein N7463_002487 [Penicillium fimorum]
MAEPFSSPMDQAWGYCGSRPRMPLNMSGIGQSSFVIAALPPLFANTKGAQMRCGTSEITTTKMISCGVE